MLTPQFDILPCGVEKEKDDTFSAVFKMIVTIHELSVLPATLIEVTKTEWDTIADAVDATLWHGKFDPTIKQLKITDDPQSPLPEVSFAIKSKDGQHVKLDSCFKFGQRLVDDKNFKPSFGFLSTSFIIPKKPSAKLVTKPLKQFEPVSSIKEIKGQIVHETNYGNILKDADTYGKAMMRATEPKQPASLQYDFRAIYATMLDEPLAAEIHFGLVREFRIPLSTLPTADGEHNYSIEITHRGVTDTKDTYVFQKKGKKCYNGLRKRFFTAKNSTDVSSASETPDFENVRFSSIDPYKKEIEGEAAHPDGIYLIGIISEKAGALQSPFDHPGVKGYTVVAKDKQGNYFSLSLHNRTVKLKPRVNGEQSNISIGNTSGYLVGKSHLGTFKANFQSNILLAWRGDNLLVNRQQAIVESEDETGTFEVEKKDFTTEDEYMSDQLMSKTDTLADRRQLPLMTGNYTFYLRPTSCVHGQLPIVDEVHPDDLDFTLTMQDIDNAVPIHQPIDFDVKPVTKLRINSPGVVGRRDYRAGNGFKDSQFHMVLNRYNNEKWESRFFYPPQRKFEELKMMDRIVPDALRRKGESNKPSKALYITRCLELEKKVPLRIPVIHQAGQRIDYLADFRSRYLYIVAADLISMRLSAKDVAAFDFKPTHPYTEGVRPAEIRIEGNAAGIFTSNIKINTWNGTVKNLSDVPDGIYNLLVYGVDQAFIDDAKNIPLSRYNAQPLKLSIVNDVPQCNVQGTLSLTVERFPGIAPNYWMQDLLFGQVFESWKSLKYLETTFAFRLESEKAADALGYYNATHPDAEWQLMKDEYPYEIFVRPEKNKGLQPFVYPTSFTLEFKLPATSNPAGTFFRFRLNDEEEVEMTYSGSKNVLNIGEASFTGDTFKIEIYFDKATNGYKYKLNSDNRVYSLKKLIYPTLSINDVKVSEEHLLKIQQDNSAGYIRFNRSNSYTIIADAREPYSQQKSIKLFASSIFQQYRSKEEQEIGSFGSELALTVPNNVNPQPPVLEADVLLMRSKSNTWYDSDDARNSKYVTTESLVRLTLQEDFMKEGRNKLGIVIKKIGKNSKPDVQVSAFGEDITKLTNKDWQGQTIDKVINFKKHGLFEKYRPVDGFVYYEIDQEVYEVAECIPFYNASLKKWQVVMPIEFEKSEVIFIKLVCMKIAPGKAMGNGSGNSITNPYADPNGTNLSVFAEPVHLPVYTKKTVIAKRTQVGGKNVFQIDVDSTSVTTNRVHFVMLAGRHQSNVLMNIATAAETDKLQDFIKFQDLTGTKDGKVLAFKDQHTVYCSQEGCYSILVVECEIHKNTSRDFPAGVYFVEQHPFFEMKGVRPINISEFVIRD